MIGGRAGLPSPSLGQARTTAPRTQPGPVAQLAEQQTLNLLVLGSTPSGLTTPTAKSANYKIGAVTPDLDERARDLDARR